MMALSPSAIRKVDAMVDKIPRRSWNLPTSFPTAELHALLEDFGFNVPSVWEDYCGASIQS
jgi:hypothetical protein